MVLSVKWNRNISDVCCWQGEKEIRYTTQSGYKALREDHHGQHRERFRYLWDLNLPWTTKIFG